MVNGSCTGELMLYLGFVSQARDETHITGEYRTTILLSRWPTIHG